MAKAVQTRLFWQKSPSADVTKVDVTLTLNGVTLTQTFGPEVTEFVQTVKANSTVQFKVTVTDSEGLTAESESAAFVVGDLVPPLPAFGLGHEFLGVIDVPDDAPPA